MQTFKIVVVVILAALLIWALPYGCSRPEEATRVLEQAGYSEIQITGWRPFMKSDSDTFSTGFRAKSPGGKIVTGAVTSGFLKGATIRVD